MAKRSIESRVAIVEGQLKTAKGKITEITIEGGFDGPGVAVRAQIIGGLSYEGEAGEDFLSFQSRVRLIAEAERAKCIIYGGMLPAPSEWEEPPGMAEALAKAAWRGADEIDCDDGL
jgi:hypothetical protein